MPLPSKVRFSFRLAVLVSVLACLVRPAAGEETVEIAALPSSQVAGGTEPAPRDGPTPGLFRLDDGRLPNVLLLTVDTLRADHVAYHGTPFPGLTPNLDRLAGHGTVFLHVTSPAPATRPALASLMSGAYVGRHRVPSNHNSIVPGVPVLADLLRKRGYRTAAFYGNGVLKPVSGFGRGFDRYTSFVRDNGVSRDDEGVERAIAWLRSQPSEPWFLWLHLMSPHGPYNSAPAPPPMVEKEPDPLPDVKLARSRSNYTLGPVVPRYQILRRATHATQYRSRYRDEVFFTDAQIERVLTALEKLDLRDSTLLIATADHGESLGEDDYFFQHGWLTHEPSVHVPMLWSMPGRVAEQRRVATNVSLVDVLPTLLTGLGFPVPATVEGRDLSPALRGEEIAPASAFVLTAYLNQVTALRNGDWKLVHTPLPPRPLPRDSWREHYQKEEGFALYDLTADPGETCDLSAAEPERFAAMRGELLAWEKRQGIPTGWRGQPESEIDEETRERLRALGYSD